VEVRIKRLRSNALLPTRATSGSTGWDLHACLDSPGYLDIGPAPVLVPTGIALESPPGLDVQVRPRSGLAKQGVMTVFGTIDSDFRGELMVTMYRAGSDPNANYRIHDGDRIAQLVFTLIAEVELRESAAFGMTARGVGGHGSTGR
jgi:dUTP diphosphatase